MQTATLPYTHRSYSQIKQLRECGYQFKLRRIDGVPERPGAANVAGTAIHIATEYVDRALVEAGAQERLLEAEDLESYALDEAFQAVEDELALLAEKGWFESDLRSYGYRPVQDLKWYRETGIPNSIKAYIDWRLSSKWQLAEIPHFGPAIEVPFNYYVEDQLIHGMIDRVFVVDGQYVPLDIKSGKPPKTDEQLGLYAAALRKALGWDVQWGYYLYYLKRGVNTEDPKKSYRLTPALRVDHWTDEKLGRVYLPATTMIDLQIFIPSPGEHCQMCGVADACEFSQAVV